MSSEPEPVETVTGSDQDEPDRADPVDGVVFFWRPGCGFCWRLRRSLRSKGLPLIEIDIWADPRAAEAVRAITGGNETVPTVVVGDAAMVNPSPREVMAAVAEQAPHLLRPS